MELLSQFVDSSNYYFSQVPWLSYFFFQTVTAVVLRKLFKFLLLVLKLYAAIETTVFSRAMALLGVVSLEKLVRVQ